jgi:L-fuculose-phosphate aldolase
MTTPLSPPAALVRAARRLDARGLVAGLDGNLSIRLETDRFLTTATATCKGMLEPEDCVEVDGRGNRLAGERDPSTEFALHAAIYARRPDVGAVVHAHPPVVTAFTLAGMELDPAVLTEGLLTLGPVLTVPYARPGTADLAHATAEALRSHRACLLAHHGAVTVGDTIEEALARMETLEQVGHATWIAHMLGGARSLPATEVGILLNRQGLTPARDG